MEEELALELHQIGAIQFGSFTLKSGVLSPIYIDLRIIVSFPELLKRIATLIWNQLSTFSYDCVCGIPYTALPIATALSIEYRLPMVMRRKEVKTYGTKKAIEGIFKKGDKCLLLEDIVTSGSSVFETIEPLEKEGLHISDIFVVLDREQGGGQKIEERGYKFHSLLKISNLMKILYREKKITSEELEAVNGFIRGNRC